MATDLAKKSVSKKTPAKRTDVTVAKLKKAAKKTAKKIVSKTTLMQRASAQIMKVISAIPPSTAHVATNPDAEAKSLIATASRNAAATSGSLALAPGMAGFLTILPDLYAVWKIQAQLVSNIAAVYGKSGDLTSEAMIYCLFRHAAAQVVRDFAVRAGERVIIKRIAPRAVRSALDKIGIKIAQKTAKAGIARFVPVLGALAVGGYAYYDTTQVGMTAVELYRSDATV